MNSKTTQTLNWQQFKDALLDDPQLDLQFQYAQDKYVDASYHITEIKQASITSVDCGGVLNSWTEIIVQLWEPVGVNQERSMKVNKALSIINIVEAKLTLDPENMVKIEYGNADFETRQMLVNNVTKDNSNLIINLVSDTTQCKASEICGVHEAVGVKSSACCTPTSGCC